MTKIVVLTGAGVSAESGLKTFRDNDGLWESHRVEDVATPEAFERNPDLVYRFYNQRREQLLSNEVRPNPAHFALAELEKHSGDDFLLITQNVDNLHEKAGNKRVIHMHGELLSAKCPVTEKKQPWLGSLTEQNKCDCCHPSSPLRPDIVWFGEMPYQMEFIYNALSDADLFVAVGTSGNVYPAAGFVQEARYHGAQTIEINLEPSHVMSSFHHQLYGLATEMVPEFVKNMIKGKGFWSW